MPEVTITSQPFIYKDTTTNYLERFVDESILENDMVVECHYMTKIQRSQNWYYRDTEKYIRKITHIVVCNIRFSATSEDNRPPPRHIRSRCFKLEEDPSNRIIGEIQCQNVMEYEDYYDDTDDENNVDD